MLEEIVDAIQLAMGDVGNRAQIAGHGHTDSSRSRVEQRLNVVRVNPLAHVHHGCRGSAIDGDGIVVDPVPNVVLDEHLAAACIGSARMTG
jgi:hypothetical protein